MGTKTHQSRRISLDAATVALLTEHHEQETARCTEIGAGFGRPAVPLLLSARPLPAVQPERGQPPLLTHGRQARHPDAPARDPALQRNRATRVRGQPAHGGRRLGHGSGGATANVSDDSVSVVHAQAPNDTPTSVGVVEVGVGPRGIFASSEKLYVTHSHSGNLEVFASKILMQPPCGVVGDGPW